MKLTGADPGPAATAALARMLQVPTIDWDRQMVLTVAVGLRNSEQLSVTKLERDGNKLTVRYRVTPSDPGATGIGYPAETVLVERSDGNVSFVEEKVPAKKPD
jgi:hypothetical protein